MSSVPTFSAYFEAVHGYAPFPWQSALAERVLSDGWPKLLDLPTGVGKTSALDVALYSWAVEPRRAPRRVVLVVDRRIVVDQGAEHAKKILKALCESEAPAAKSVAQRLRESWGAGDDEEPFAIAVLRGGMPRDNDWARRPDQPVLGVSTVDQVGSRLFFRGYGVGAMSASIHAGMLGHDTLILLDEVHLAQPFAETLRAVLTRYRKPVASLPDRFAVVEMSATPGKSVEGAFQLSKADREHEVLSARLTSSKPARLVQVKVHGDDAKKKQMLAAKAVEEALRLQKEGAAVVGIVVNRVETARLAFRELGAERALLVTGRMRPLDRDRIVTERLVPGAGTGRTREAASPLIVVATQCIEAGADLDFDGLVTECASLDALQQRFGRLDRRGERVISPAVVLIRSDDEKNQDDAVYGPALAQTWQWLKQNATNEVVDFGVDALANLGDAGVDVLAPRLSAPVLLPAQLDAWTQTSHQPVHDPDVSLWLHGPKRTSAEVQVVWRTGMDDLFEASDAETLHELLSACRPSSLEAMSLPIGAARAWLQKEDAETIADVVVTNDVEEPRDSRRRQSTALRVYRWGTGGRSGFVDDPRNLKPGDIVVVPSSYGGLFASNFDPASQEPVDDLGDLAEYKGRRIASRRVRFSESLPPPGEDENARAFRERLLVWLEAQPGLDRAMRAALLSRRPQIIGDTVILSGPFKLEGRRYAPLLEETVTEGDDSSFRSSQVTLAAHNTHVQQVARRFAEAIGFSKALVDDLALAAWLHDIGKADPRFQRWLVGGSEVAVALLTEPIAKSGLPAGRRHEREEARIRAGYPPGYRHELLSLGLIQENASVLAQAHDPELVMHLVASHHGWCRPFAPFQEHLEDLPVELKHGEFVFKGSTCHRLARLDSGVSDRFWALIDRYGWWGLAWLEAVIRLADHRASEEVEGRKEDM